MFVVRDVFEPGLERARSVEGGYRETLHVE
jgi:hypothetical protein